MGLLDAEAHDYGKQGQSQGEAGNLRRRSQQLQVRIADALGLPVAAFDRGAMIHPGAHEVLDAAQAELLAMNQDCSALIEAYTRIMDPQERQRLLKIVREAAGRSGKA